MEIFQKPFDIQDVHFTSPLIDRVHVESLCRLLRKNTNDVDMASHSTEHGKLVMRIRMKRIGVDVRDYIKQAAQVRSLELEAMSQLFVSE